MSLRIGLVTLLLFIAANASAFDSGRDAHPAEIGKTVQEPEPPLSVAIQRRCEAILAHQLKIRDETVKLNQAIKANNDGKPTGAQEKTVADLSDRQRVLVALANEAIKKLEKEESIVAFIEVFKQVRSDMRMVEDRLGKADTGAATLEVENDIIGTLEDMIDALKPRRPIREGQKQLK